MSKKPTLQGTAHGLETHQRECAERYAGIEKQFQSVHREIAALRGEMRWAMGGLGALILAVAAAVIGVG